MNTSNERSLITTDNLTISSIWTHLVRTVKPLRRLKMSSPEVYTSLGKDDNGKDLVTVKEEGFLTPSMINQVTFEFAKPSEITEDLEKSKKKENQASSSRNFGDKKTRVGLAGCSVRYPNGEKANKAVIPGAIIQYRETLSDPDPQKAKGYADSYVDIGIPEYVMTKLMNDAKRKGINLQPKNPARVKNGYHWLTTKTDDLKVGAVTMLLTYTENGKEMTSAYPFGIRQLLQLNGKNVLGTISFGINAVTVCDYDKKLDLEGAQYYPSFKISTAYIETSTDISGPDFTELVPRLQNETFEPTFNNAASGELLTKALQALGIKST